jgi:hypothetical protein
MCLKGSSRARPATSNGGGRDSVSVAVGVLQARVMEGGEGGAGLLQEDDVVLTVPLIRVGRLCTGWSAEGRGSPALWPGSSGGRT